MKIIILSIIFLLSSSLVVSCKTKPTYSDNTTPQSPIASNSNIQKNGPATAEIQPLTVDPTSETPAIINGLPSVMTVPKGFLTDEDFSIGKATITPRSPDNISNDLSSSGGIFPNPSTIDDCANPQAFDDIKVVANRTNIQAVGKAAVSCNSSSGKFTGNYDLYVYLSCGNTDLSMWNGKSLRYLLNFTNNTNIWKVCPTGESYVLFNNRMIGNVAANVKGQKFNIPMELLFALTTKDGQGCHFQSIRGLNYIDNGCMEAVKGIIRMDETTTLVTIQKNEFINVTMQPNGTYYNSGQIHLLLDDWSGTIYFRGSDNAPLYAISNGDAVLQGRIIPASN